MQFILYPKPLGTTTDNHGSRFHSISSHSKGQNTVLKKDEKNFVIYLKTFVRGHTMLL